MKNIITIVIAILSFGNLSAQDYEFGKVSIDEVENNVYEKDTSASAVVLYKNRKTYFNYVHPDGWVVINEIHKRVKILNKDGFDYATEKLRIYKNGGDKERMSSIKGLTYNIENGKLKTEKLKKSAIFKNEATEYYDEQSFTMPNAKEGSVLEWKYKITSPFWKIDNLVIQEDIPTDYYLAKIQVPEYFKFKKMVKGGYAINPKEYIETRKMKVSYENSGSLNDRVSNMRKTGGTRTGLTKTTQEREISVREQNTEYDLINIPALQKEPYVNNINNYRLTVNYELMSAVFPGGSGKVYSTTWDDVIKTINEHQNFGGQLNKTKFLNDDIASIKALGNNQIEQIYAAFNLVKNRMNWNGNYGKYTDKGLQKAYKEKVGNVSEINLMLVALLKESGIKANPVLISTRKYGIPVFPTLDGFNYVVACAEIDGQDILMDATNKNLIPGLLPSKAINWEGTLVMSNGSSRKVNLFPRKASRNDIMMNIEVSEEGDIKGKRRSSLTDLDALSYRNNFGGTPKEERVESIISDNDFLDVSDYEIKNLNNLGKPIVESYSFEIEDAVDQVGNDIYISPLFQLALNENPFKSQERIYPVDFVYPVSRKKIVTITIPVGYKVTSIPKPIKLNLPDNLGSFLFNIKETPTGLNLITDFKINAAIIPTKNYLELKEFYNQRVLKEAEKVVLSKQ